MRFGERAAEDGEVLAEDEYEPAVDHAVAGDDAIARRAVVGHAEVVVAVLDEHVPFLERVLVQQKFDALAGRQLALGVLRGDALFAAAEPGAGTLGFELLDDVVHGLVVPKLVLLPFPLAGEGWGEGSSHATSLTRRRERE